MKSLRLVLAAAAAPCTVLAAAAEGCTLLSAKDYPGVEQANISLQ